MIIPLEVAHNLYKIPKITGENIEKLLFQWITQKNIVILNATKTDLIKALELLNKYKGYGIGGRDCLILASLIPHSVKTIVTHP